MGIHNDNEIDSILEFQMEVVSGNLNPEEDQDPFDDGPVWNQTMVKEAWRWCIENDENPRHVENSLNRYSKNFAPSCGGEPLVLGNEPPDEVKSEFPDFSVPQDWKLE